MKRFGKYSVWVTAFLFATGLLIVYKSLDSFDTIRRFFADLVGIISPFIIGFVIAYLLNAPMKKLNNIFKKSKNSFIKVNSLKLSVVSVYIIALALLTLASRLIFPPLYKNILDLCQNMPTYINRTISYIKSLQLENIFPAFNLDTLLADIPLSKFFSSLDFSVLGKYLQGVMGVTTNMINIFIGIIISIYILLDKNKITAFIFRLLTTFTSERTVRNVAKYLKRINDIFSKFICAQLIDAVIVATLTSIVLSLLKVRYALVLGIMLGLFNLIPYFGAIVAAVIAVIITIFTGGALKALWTAIALITIQQIDGNIIGPKIMGNSLEISPLLIIFAVTFGGGFFGIWGMLLSVPVVALLKTILNDCIEYRERKNSQNCQTAENERTCENG